MLQTEDCLNNDVVYPDCGFRQHFTSALNDADGRRAKGVITGAVLGFSLSFCCLLGRAVILMLVAGCSGGKIEDHAFPSIWGYCWG
ncbi:hypothetical protein IJT93_07450 [bacterium]|nr:hypothetical protein [bacterium]